MNSWYLYHVDWVLDRALYSQRLITYSNYKTVHLFLFAEPDDIPPWILNGFDTGGPDISEEDEFDIKTIPQSTPNFNLVVSETNEKAVDQVSSLDVTIIAVATACVVLVLLAIVAVLLYKVKIRNT